MYQASARLIGRTDVIEAFEDRIVLILPNVRGIQPLDRKLMESLLILGFGLRRNARKSWGL